jgi:hypothetical protein
LGEIRALIERCWAGAPRFVTVPTASRGGRRARQHVLPPFRATGITAYLQSGGTLEKAQQIANHESPRTTKIYDRSNDTLTLDEIERITL